MDKIKVILLCLSAIMHFKAGSCGKCKTPDQKVGNCIPLKKCPELLVQLDQNRHNVSFIQTLQKLTCGFIKSSPKVCCRTRKKSLQKLQLLPFGSQCGKRLIKFGNRIVGGRYASLGFYPWLARLGYLDRDEGLQVDYSCAGTLINERYILTAAHCTIPDQPGIVQLGEYNTFSDPDCNSNDGCSLTQTYKVEKVIVHKKYSYVNKNHDISLIRLAKPVNFTEFIQPICLPFKLYSNTNLALKTNSREPNEEIFGIIAGWGRTKLHGRSSLLKHAEVPIISQSKCLRMYRGQVKISDDQICAGGEEGVDSCDGDSGGPLMYGDESFTFFQLGIISFGPEHCGSKSEPGIYTSVTHYLKWILKHIEY